MKVVINTCFGGFGLSEAATIAYRARKEEVAPQPMWAQRALQRHDPDLVAVVEEMGALANNRFSDLKVVEIPDNVDYEIQEYDGQETIAECHRTWS